MPDRRRKVNRARTVRTWLAGWLAIWCWCYLTWIVITWERAAENLAFGAVAAAVCAVALAPLGPALKPWRLLSPRRVMVVVQVGAHVLVHLVMANISLSRRIWSPRLPLRPGMVVVPTLARSDGELTAVGMLTSLVVDNQIVDLDRKNKELQYHGVWCGSADGTVNRSKINGRLEDLLVRLRP